MNFQKIFFFFNLAFQPPNPPPNFYLGVESDDFSKLLVNNGSFVTLDIFLCLSFWAHLYHIVESMQPMKES